VVVGWVDAGAWDAWSLLVSPSPVDESGVVVVCGAERRCGDETGFVVWRRDGDGWASPGSRTPDDVSGWDALGGAASCGAGLGAVSLRLPALGAGSLGVAAAGAGAGASAAVAAPPAPATVGVAVEELVWRSRLVVVRWSSLFESGRAARSRSPADGAPAGAGADVAWPPPKTVMAAATATMPARTADPTASLRVKTRGAGSTGGVSAGVVSGSVSYSAVGCSSLMSSRSP
jgi:hypothetical protein